MMYEAKVVEDENGELALEFPDELVERMNWKPDDTIIWEEFNGFWTLRVDNSAK